MTAKYPYAPPLAELDVHGASHGMACQVRYRLGRFDYFTWNILHQLRLIPLQVICVAPAIALALQVQSYSLSIATGLLAYVLLWSTQIAFLAIVIYTGRNKHLLTEHTVELQADAFYVATEYGRQYHYWRGIQRVLDGPRIPGCLYQLSRRTHHSKSCLHEPRLAKSIRLRSPSTQAGRL
jgi:hypothetical protein